MNTIKLTTLKSTIAGIVKANDESNLQAVYANVVYQGLVHGNILPNQMAALRNSKANPKLKAGLAKHMPMAWTKASKSVKTAHYSFDAAKQDALRVELGITKTSTLDEVAEALPTLFTPAKKPAEYDRDTYLTNVAKKLTKEGEQEVESIMAVMSALLEHPELVGKAARAVMAGAQESSSTKAA